MSLSLQYAFQQLSGGLVAPHVINRSESVQRTAAGTVLLHACLNAGAGRLDVAGVPHDIVSEASGLHYAGKHLPMAMHACCWTMHCWHEFHGYTVGHSRQVVQLTLETIMKCNADALNAFFMFFPTNRRGYGKRRLVGW